MHIRLHPNARTTLATVPRSPPAVAASQPCARYHIGQGTIGRRRKRKVFIDTSHTVDHLQTILNSAQEMIVI
jgi:hypothetical protein